MIIGNQLPNMPTFSVTSEIGEMISDAGAWCAKFINWSINIFRTLCNSSLNFLGTKLRSSTFSDFWGVINTLSSVFARIAGSLVVLFFIYKLFEEISDSRNQLDVFSFARSCLKVGIASVLVSNATRIVTYILNIGVLLSQLVVTLAGKREIDFDTDITLSDDYMERLEESITGLQGFILLIVFVIGGIAIIVCGAVILIAVYQRVFKIFVLIPFAAFSFSTYTLPDSHGHEVFSGYLKGILKTSFEACVISLIIAFAFILMKNNTMEDILPLDLSSRELVYEGTITSDADICYLYYSVSGGLGTAVGALELWNYTYNDLSDGAIKSYNAYKSSSKKVYINGKEMTGEVLAKYYFNTHGGNEYPITCSIYETSTWGDALLILIYYLFPAMLAAAAVKEVDKFTGIIVGGGA